MRQLRLYGDASDLLDADEGVCDSVQRRVDLSPISKKSARAHETQADGWTLETHVCRHCFGRLVSRALADRRAYLCTNCGAEAVGESPDVLCSCGTTLRRHAGVSSPVNAGLRCQLNPSPSPDFPSLFVASEVKT